MNAPPERAVKWQIPDRQPDKERVLQDALGIPAIVACVLINRGFDTPDSANAYLNPSLDSLASPTLLPGYDAAKKEILGARERKETIYVHGDYDVDGVTSAALLTRFLGSIGAIVKVHVPHRIKGGYGIHESTVRDAAASGAKLLLTCDCGISAIEPIKLARELGMRVVVTDHHTIGAEIPDAEAIVNPHLAGAKYPYHELCGAGVVFRLCEGLTQEVGYNVDKYRRAFLDLAVLGTVADVMPLTGENRIIAKHGLKNLYETKKVGLRAMLNAAELSKEKVGRLKAWHIGFVLGPRLNAMGRIDDAVRSLNLLLTSDEKEARVMAAEIEQVNKTRKEQMDEMIEKAIQRVVDEGLYEKYAIVLAAEDWHPGLIGLVASRLVERFRRPTFVVSIDSISGKARASGRSIPGFHLADTIRAHAQLVSGGGHAMAAGFETKAELVPEVSRAFDQYASEILTEEDFILKLNVEAGIKPGEANMAAARALEMLEPFGCENPEPIFEVESACVTGIETTSKPEHPRMVIRLTDGTGPAMKAMAFGMGERLQSQTFPFETKMLINVRVDTWNGRESAKWEIRHFEPVNGWQHAEPDDESLVVSS
jgi:single-stranded-DNA-specific exonuclease